MSERAAEKSGKSAELEPMLVVDGLECHNWDRELFEAVNGGGVSAVNTTVAIWENARETIKAIGKWRRFFREHADLIMPATCVSDVMRAHALGKTAIILGFQNTSPIEDDIELVGVFAELGVRIMQLTYNNQNLVGAGCYEEHDSGLTWFGRDVVKEMNALGILIDLSHVGDRTSLDTARLTTKPLAITHANPLSVVKRHRNKSDDVIRAVAETGGVIGLSVEPGLLPNAGETTIDQFCEMVTYVAGLVGVEHVGMGTDHYRKHSLEVARWWLMGNWSRDIPEFADIVPRGWRGEEAKLPDWFHAPVDLTANIAPALRERGFSADEVRSIMGGNWLRVFGEVFADTASPAPA